MKSMTRRTFLQRSGATALGLATSASVLGSSKTAPVMQAGEKVNVALIGCGARGRLVARGMLEEGANLTHLCDLHPERLEETRAFLTDWTDKKPALVREAKAVLDSSEVDAVIVATPDHWHAPMSILACQAGKDVYVEKPHAHNIWESNKFLEAATKYKRVVQVGTQCRSAPYLREALDYIRSGNLGRISLVKVYNLKPGDPFNLGPAETRPDGFNWDTWLGRAPARPYHQRIFRNGWHHFWDFSGGDLADDGIHQLDLAVYLMGDPGFPRSVRSVGGRLAHAGDDSEVPDVLVSNWEFADFVMTFEHSNYPKYMRKTDNSIRRNDVLPYWTQNSTRIELYGADLMMTVGRHGGGWIVQREAGREVEKRYGRPSDQEHFRNFLDCVKTREQPNANLARAHVTNAMLVMANIAHRTGNVALKYDPGSREFDNPAATALIKPEYRKGFEIPDRV